MRWAVGTRRESKALPPQRRRRQLLQCVSLSWAFLVRVVLVFFQKRFLPLPEGSGKSTFSEKVAKKAKIERFARDELGSTEAVKKGMTKALKHGNVLVDCVNIHPKDRIMWATVSRAANPSTRLVLVHIDCPVELCIARAQDRKNHPTLSPDNAQEVVEMFAKGFKLPETWELGKMKYEKMFRVSSAEDATQCLQELQELLS